MGRVTEVGLLQVFRLFAVIQIVQLVFVTLLVGADKHPPHPPAAMAVMVGASCLLLAYLLWPRLEARLGAAYLYLAVALCTAVPFVGLAMTVARDPASFWDLGSDVSLLLFFPLLVISWQYDFRAVVVFTVATTLLDGVIAHFAIASLGWEAHDYHRLSVVRAAAFLCAGYIITRLMKEQRAQREALHASNLELQRLAGVREQLATSRERNRLARELHDTLAHTLTGVAVQLEAVRTVWETDSLEARGLLDKAHAGARSGLVETRRALAALRASPLESLGLAMAIRSLAEEAASRGGLELDLALPEGELVLDEDDAQALYRVVQEALENVVRHAGAHHLSVSLSCGQEGTCLTVADDGSGFDLARSTAGTFGLAGMRERAAARGGELAIESRPGAGTTVRLCLPGSRVATREVRV